MAKKLQISAIIKAVDRVTKPMRKAQKSVNRATKRMRRAFSGLNRVSNKVIRGMASMGRAAVKLAAIGFGALAAGVGLVVREFSKVEDAQAAFTPLMGGAERAEKMVARLNETAASTPFQFDTLQKSAQQLAPVMNKDIERTIKTMRMLGDTAGGNAQKLDSITRGFTKASLKGKVDLESLNMIAEAGVPIFQELATSLGTTVGPKFFKNISAGKVKVEDLTKTFENMTSEGGVFFKGMEIASKTTSGIFSTLKDNVALTAASLGETLAPTIKEIMTALIGVAGKARAWMDANKDLIKQKVADFVERMRKGLAAFVKTVKDFVVKRDGINKIMKAFESIGKAIAFLGRHAKTIGIIIGVIVGLIAIVKILIGVLTLVNLVMAANPVVLIVLAVIALIAAIVALVVKFKLVEKAVKAFGVASKWVKEKWADFKKWIGEMVDSAKEKWEGFATTVRDIFVRIWETVKAYIGKIKGFVGGLWDGFKGLLGIGGEVDDVKAKVDVRKQLEVVQGGSEGDSRPRGEMRLVSPTERVSKQVNEDFQTTTNQTELTVRDETGRVEVTKGSLGKGVKLERTGSF